MHGIRTSVQPDQIVPPTASIEIEVPGDVDLEATRLPVAVRGLPGTVGVEDGGRRLRWTPYGTLPPGEHTLVVDPLVGPGGRRISPGFQVRFVVADTTVRPDQDVVIESLARIRFNEFHPTRLPLDRRPTGAFVDVAKATRRGTGEPVTLAADQDGREVDVADLHQQMLRRRAEAFGKIHEDLHRLLAGTDPDEPVRVAVWLHVEDQQDLFDERARTRLRGDEQAMPDQARQQREAIAQVTRSYADRLEQVQAREVRPARLAPVVRATVPARSVRDLARDDTVAAVFLYDPEGVDDLDDSMDIAASDTVHGLGFTGSGARVAVWERGPDSTADLDVEDQFDATPDTSDHSRHVHGIIKNTQSGAPNGHAPDCLLYSANSYDLDALEWAVEDGGCRIINQSFHRTAEATGGSLSFDDVYKDWLVLHWPYPFITQAAGNTGEGGADIDPPSDEYVNHKGYNSLTVGNHNDDSSDMSASTVFRNPTSLHGDRELPEIAANGTSVTAVGLTKSGTSMASPAVAGAAALLHDTHPSLRVWPEACRAILLAGATRNITGSTWWADVSAGTDAFDGAGALNALESHRIAQVRRSPDGGPARRGWDAGRLGSADVDAAGLSTFAYRLAVPSAWWGPRRVKVALAWDSVVSSIDLPFLDPIPVSSTLTVDLDLKVFDSSGSLVGYAGSWDNSYEIAEFDAVPGGTYDIRIRRWSGTDPVWFGIAWTVTGGLVLPWRRGLVVRRLIQG